MASRIASLLLVCLFIGSEFTQVDTIEVFLSSSLRAQKNKYLQADAPAPAPAPAEAEAPVGVAPDDDEDITLKLVEKTSLGSKGKTECLCPLGEFWHWRIADCIKQGGFGYECGFFPQEHWHRVCEDTYKCEALDVPDNYRSHGKYAGTANSAPASCRKCEEGDSCPVGDARHKDECMKAYGVTGEACATVKVTKANAKKEISAVGKACASADEAYEALDVKPGKDVGAVLAAKLISKGDELAFERASKAAIDSFEKGLDAEKAAKVTKKAKKAAAKEQARQKSEALAKEAEGWKAEAGDNKAAQAAAESRAEEIAKEQKRLLEVIDPPAQQAEVPRQEPKEPDQFKKITDEQMKETLP